MTHRDSQGPSHEERRPEALAPALDCDLGWEDVAHVEREPRIEFLLKHDDRVLMEVAEIQLLPGADHLWVLLDVQPAHVGEEKTAHGVMRISVSLTVLVVDAVVAGPVVDRSLVRDGVAQHEEET